MTRKNKRDIQLLDKCIDHWFDNITMLQLNYYSGERGVNLYKDVYISGDHCPLCQIYNGLKQYNCCGCPIYIKTNYYSCRQTPYYDICYCSSIFKKLFKAFSNELNFLINLREELSNG